MPTPITNLTVNDLQEFYPVTDSLTQHKIGQLTSMVKTVTFMSMFGLELSNKIFAGEIADSASDNFIGFKKLVALCIVGQLIEDTFIHTNAGLKVVNQPSWSSPRVAEKNTQLMKINNTIEAQFTEAKKILAEAGALTANTYSGFSAFNIRKV